uniref:Uncharacterized protein n=1 Tax=Anguilla anguilla TaxID=7936 RepID=A0A0E9T468_ANGAN
MYLIYNIELNNTFTHFIVHPYEIPFF